MTQDTPAALPGTIAKGPLHAIHASPAVRDALLAYHDRPADDEAAAVVSAILAHQAATSAAGGAADMPDRIESQASAVDVLLSIEVALQDGHSAGSVLDENSPLRDAVRTVLARANSLPTGGTK